MQRHAVQHHQDQCEHAGHRGEDQEVGGVVEVLQLLGGQTLRVAQPPHQSAQLPQGGQSGDQRHRAQYPETERHPTGASRARPRRAPKQREHSKSGGTPGQHHQRRTYGVRGSVPADCQGAIGHHRGRRPDHQGHRAPPNLRRHQNQPHCDSHRHGGMSGRVAVEGVGRIQRRAIQYRLLQHLGGGE